MFNSLGVDILNEICKYLDGDDIVRMFSISKEMRRFQIEHDMFAPYKKKILMAVNNRRRYCLICKNFMFNMYYYTMLLCDCIDSQKYPYYHTECIGLHSNIVQGKNMVTQTCPWCLSTTNMLICDICS